jgi:predicted YcjX-like family ATPase
VSLIADLLFEARNAATSLADYVGGSGLRLGLTGLSKAGKTVFLTALVQNLLHSGAARKDTLPVFRVHAEGRLAKALLQPQPDDAVPRFAFEDHAAALTGTDRHWPESTRRISELRMTLEFDSRAGWRGGASNLTIDIVDYPGEWLLDLPLLSKSFAEWSRETLAASALPGRLQLATDWQACLSLLDPQGEADEDQARHSATLFTAYLRACRNDRLALSTLPPGRFLMPGDMEGSPALTFSPLRLEASAPLRRDADRLMIGVAMGVSRRAALRGALVGKLISGLVTDEATAEHLLQR